jgi:hypothetical protein
MLPSDGTRSLAECFSRKDKVYCSWSIGSNNRLAVDALINLAVTFEAVLALTGGAARGTAVASDVGNFRVGRITSWRDVWLEVTFTTKALEAAAVPLEVAQNDPELRSFKLQPRTGNSSPCMQRFHSKWGTLNLKLVKNTGPHCRNRIYNHAIYKGAACASKPFDIYVIGTRTPVCRK